MTEKIRELVSRGDFVVAKRQMEMSGYPNDNLITVKRGEKFLVSTIGSGEGEDHVIALGARGRDISIAPWRFVDFDVARRQE